GVTDNFFEAGGDSILSLRIISRAAQAGLKLTPRQVFENPDIVRLAALATSHDTTHKPEVLTSLPLTPIQQAFFERYPQGQSHWNQSLLLKVDGALERTALAAALAHLVRSFDALRLRFLRSEAGWRQQVQPADSAAPSVLSDIIDLRGQADWRAQLEQQGAALQRSLDIEHGPLIRAAYFALDGEARLLLTIHHLAVDGVSWRVLLDTLQQAYQQISQGRPAPELVATPWSVWVAESVDSARHVLAQQELPWWQARLAGAGNDSETTAAATASPAQQQRQPHRRRLQFNAAITEQLLSQPARVYGAGLDEFLLTALGRSIAAHSGAQQLLVSLEGHGREAVDSELDLSNSVGWFTARFPLCLEIHDDAAAALIATKENLRSVPHKGVRWGWLRTYGDAATRAAVAALPAPAINFNYLGQFDQSLQRDGVFHFADEPFGAAMADEGSSAYALDFSAVVAAGALTVDWRLAPASWSIEAADRMVADFERQVHALLQHCQSAAPVRTASDFALAGLSQPSLQELLSAHLTDLPAAAIADIYPATPLQTGLLYHSLTQAGQGLYLIQKRLSLTGALNPEAMRGAWQLAVTRHAILRTRFVWQHGGAPLQVVAKNSDLPFVQHDWRSLDAAAYEQRMQHWLAQDLAAGFDAGVAPLLRINLFARADGHCDLVWTGHHLLTDGWSSAQLLGEVMQAYRLLNAGQPVTMDAPAPYRDYVVWLRRQPDASAWWQSRLSEVRDPANLGSCLSAPAVDINAGIGAEQATVALRPELSERLAQTARRHRVTVNTLIQGAWALLLARFGNRDQVVFGVTVSGRPHDLPGMERMLGLFINSLPLWLEVPAAMRLSAWLAGIQERNSALRQYEHTDLGQIQQWAGQSGASLFDSLLVFENYPVDEEMRKEATGLTLERYQAVERSHYPLVLTAGPGRSLTLNWKWDPARLDQQTIAAWSAAYLAVLEQFAGAEDVCVGEIAVDSAPAQQQVLAWSRPTTTAPKLLAPRSELLHVLIEQQAARQPAAIAVVGEHGQQLSYAELNTRANHLAWRLIDMGVAPEVKVGLAFARSADMLVAMLAVLKAGGAYVPLDPEYPQERLAYMIGDSAIGLILSESSVRAHLPALDAEAVRVLELDRLSDPDQRSHNPQVLQHQDALAYVIYTSGSTGRPKGAQLTHRNVARLLSGTEQHFAFSSSDVWTLFHSYAFDFSVWEIFGALCHGGRLIVVPFAVSRAPADFLDLLRRQGVTVLNQTPSAFRQLLEVPELYRAEDLALRLVIFGGEALEPRTLRPWLAHFGDQRVQLVNMYGITETTVHVTYRRILQTDLEGRASPVGAQIADLGLYVLDVHGRLAAVGVAGELFVAGDGLARGYLHRAALTAERFVPDPFSAQGGRLYRTGDLARRTADGQLEYLGRIDQQVKIRGFRIEIGEVEAQLLALPQVREACVLADQGPSGTRLIAYVTAASAVVGATLDAQQLRTQLAARLPDYMLPAALMVLAKLPLTPNGKIDRRALPAAAVDAGVGAGPAYVAPQGEVEQQLALVWQEVLELEQVGRTDNFFALGGDSILSLQVVARARKRGVEITPKQLFETPTVAGLAQALALPRAPAMLADSLKLPATADYSAFALAKLSQQDLLRLPIVLAEVQDIYPATPLQNGMLFHSLLQNGQGVYIDQNCFTLVGTLDLAALNTAWSVAVQRHDILRTHFRWEHGGDALQVVQRQAELALTLHDWSDRSQAAYAAELAAWRAVDLAAGFALDCAPLLRINLFVRPDGRHDCVSTNHHVLLDGWSYAQLVGEVMHVYQAEAKHQPYQLGAPGAYRDYIAWMAAQPSVRDWWMARYARVDAPVGVGASVLSASASSLYASDRLKHIVQELDLDATAALEAAAKRHQVSINTLVQGAWALLLGRYGNRDQAAFGVTVSGRPGDLPEIEKVLGLFINSLPLWVSLPAGDGVGAWLSALQGDNYALREHGYASVSQLQQWTGLSGEALFDSLVVFENYPIDRALRDGLQDLRIEGYQITERTHYPMVLVAVPASRFRFRFKFDAARISDAMATQLAQHFLELLQQLMQAQPELPLGSLQLSVTRNSNTVRADYPFIPVAQRISARALAQPQAPALHCEGQRLSYGQLEQWASQVGRRLHDDGVQAEERVGLCVTRSVAMVAGLLGIFKSGGAFLPLDPDYPPDRLALMLDDAGVRTVVADADTATQLADVLAGRKVLRLDQLNGVSTKPFQLPVLADQLAYVIYTSGSTGKPKGVAISQRAL
ncbi:non-ribosomal peptide synthase/amino acid adenylation enzyme, partial [Herbaspirillum sp. CF444]|uniref:non-ribosomal peptide synthetase n=1 Tax=Herbaspirillum sp. CF444 TaxID=1144319 RepID=UPI0002727342